MKKLSVWARNHKNAARLLIIFSFVILTILGLFTGILLADLDLVLSTTTYFLISILFCTGLLRYPPKELRRKYNARTFYIRQKSCDFLLAATTFCLLVVAGQHPEKIFRHFPESQASVIPLPLLVKDSILKKYKSINEFSASMKDQNGKQLKWKERKKLMKQQVRHIKKTTELSGGAKITLIILSVLVALGLVYLVAGLACSLSCSGAEGAAVLLGIGGTGLIIFLLIITIRAITGKKRRKKTVQEIKPEI